MSQDETTGQRPTDSDHLMASTHHSTQELEPGLHAVMAGGSTVGYVHRVGRVFVALRGRRYDYAEEVGQAHDFRRAVGIVHAENDSRGLRRAPDWLVHAITHRAEGARGLRRGPATGGSERLKVLPLGPGQWRVLDPMRSEDGRIDLVGYIEKVPEGFEVVELDHPSDRRLLPTFDQAVQSLS